MNENKSRLLLIDDDPILLRSLSRQLVDHGFEIETTSGAAEARAMLKRQKFQAVICDHNMPGLTGLEFLEEIRSAHPQMATFMLSGQVAGLQVAEDWAREIGVTEIFSKPCHSDWIAASIEKALSPENARSGVPATKT